VASAFPPAPYFFSKIFAIMAFARQFFSIERGEFSEKKWQGEV
jgi:hypothetical protein